MVTRQVMSAMWQRGFFRITAALFFLPMLLLQGGCSGGGGSSESALRGWVHGTEKVSGASLDVYRVTGNVPDTLHEITGSKLSSEHGAFRLNVKALSSDFRLVARGGGPSGTSIHRCLRG